LAPVITTAEPVPAQQVAVVISDNGVASANRSDSFVVSFKPAANGGAAA
jgi:hypothetical protein